MKNLKLHLGMTAMFIALVFVAGTATAGPNPYNYPDDAYVSLNGEVKAVGPDWFTLDFDDGLITVEMDDGDRDADAYSLLEGDKVTVYGRIDSDLFEQTTIEAGSVFVEKLGTYFYASSIDEEDYDFLTVPSPAEGTRMMIQGKVSEVKNDEFAIKVGDRQVWVDVDEMAYNPLDDEGYQKIEPGDIVNVTGEVDYDFFEGRELMAKTIIKISG